MARAAKLIVELATPQPYVLGASMRMSPTTYRTFSAELVWRDAASPCRLGQEMPVGIPWRSLLNCRSLCVVAAATHDCSRRPVKAAPIGYRTVSSHTVWGLIHAPYRSYHLGHCDFGL